MVEKEWALDSWRCSVLKHYEGPKRYGNLIVPWQLTSDLCQDNLRLTIVRLISAQVNILCSRPSGLKTCISRFQDISPGFQKDKQIYWRFRVASLAKVRFQLSESFIHPLFHRAGLKPIKRRSSQYSTHLSYWKNDIIILNVTWLFCVYRSYKNY